MSFSFAPVNHVLSRASFDGVGEPTRVDDDILTGQLVMWFGSVPVRLPYHQVHVALVQHDPYAIYSAIEYAISRVFRDPEPDLEMVELASWTPPGGGWLQ